MTTEATAPTENTTTDVSAEGAPHAPAPGTTQSGEQTTTQAEGGGDGTETLADGEREKPTGPPEKYEFTAPEGFEVNQETLTGYEGLAREAGLSQEQFAKVTEYGLKYFQGELGKQAEAHSARERGWLETTLGDKDLSDGKTLNPAVKENVGHVFTQFGGDELRKALDETGAGNHPAVIRAFNQIGKALGAALPPDTGKPASELRGNSFEDIASRRYSQG
ncbi:hypothetical protein JRX38_14195 [Gluconobacter cerinus]|uniref:hypothetical protein n=1 Tax=Gluconobacter cerinus TaxID=38307 RepID=UPI00193FD984|nr:hypothetical protein [Gluconobacter cerinus]MBM3099138.1 hypothetical protein [Gluconobacter cerinus]